MRIYHIYQESIINGKKSSEGRIAVKGQDAKQIFEEEKVKFYEKFRYCYQYKMTVEKNFEHEIIEVTAGACEQYRFKLMCYFED